MDMGIFCRPEPSPADLRARRPRSSQLAVSLRKTSRPWIGGILGVASIGLAVSVMIASAAGDSEGSATSSQPPTITLNRTRYPAGAKVVVRGNNLEAFTRVLVNGQPVHAGYANGVLTFILPTNATSGLVSVESPYGNAQTLKPIIIGPYIADLTPRAVSQGTVVTISGWNLDNPSRVRWGSSPVEYYPNADGTLSFTVPNANHLQASRVTVVCSGIPFASTQYLQPQMDPRLKLRLLLTEKTRVNNALGQLDRLRPTNAARSMLPAEEMLDRYLSAWSANASNAVADLAEALVQISPQSLASGDLLSACAAAKPYALAAFNDIEAELSGMGQMSYHLAGDFTFVVPSGVSNILVVAVGGAGGNGGDCYDPSVDGYTSGNYAPTPPVVSRTVSVSPGDVFEITIQARGAPPDSDNGNGGTGGAVSVELNSQNLISVPGGAGGEGGFDGGDGACDDGERGTHGTVKFFW